jgi:hypothetical protein
VAWDTAGILTNPATDAILADSGQKQPSSCEATIVLGGSVAAVATIEYRDAANAANLKAQVIACAANDVTMVRLPGLNFALNERLRLRLNVGVTGSVSASIFT